MRECDVQVGFWHGFLGEVCGDASLWLLSNISLNFFTGPSTNKYRRSGHARLPWLDRLSRPDNSDGSS